MHKNIRALIVALALTIALPVSVFAQQSATSVGAETITVLSTLTVTGVPATMAYGSGLPGTTPSWGGALGANPFTASTNNAAGLTLSVLGSDLARTGGGATIPGSARTYRVAAGSLPTDCVLKPGTWTASPWKAQTDSVTFVPFCSNADTNTATVPNFTSVITIPAGQMPGIYTGTFTLKAEDN